MDFKLPVLPYDYDDLEPFLDKETMKIHHTKHHQTYINNTNSAKKNFPLLNKLNIENLVKKLNIIPEKNEKIFLQNNAGGHLNHSLFWKFLKKNTPINVTLKFEIEKNFDSINNFKNIFEKTAMNHFGSGWVWIIKKNNKLKIISTINQNNPLMGKEISGHSGYPILGLDLWEHAYYLKYQNRKIEYIKAFWNIINWEEVEKQFNNV
ncbi:Superoxide dismutase [Mn] [Candidatus Westeberhardia cardiocondylae]|uniref:Superoxide dismutase n=1 Tax=Candidatus Westeberhardia cardiocondylae TaxID=1594731 RepID=A0A0H5BWJ1_9ENTR|nr:Fe-Mn family superoxide dismutase [Candidatus Westeberhardia cardiocondylae]MCR3756355.1 superoxide dismutase (Mn) [Candidatus Westeberhardia cardiocondylae]CEN31998.1 Superoxide dismutase [Mn] [Candidatus Westeberhardia cardiocondylae]